MPFFWEGLLGLSLVVCSNASPRPEIPHGYTLFKSTDAGKSTTYEEIGFYTYGATLGASATFVPKYDATVVSGKTLPFVTTTNDAGAPVTWIGDWNTDAAGSATLVPVQVCSEAAQPLEGRSKLVQGRDLVCAEVSASTPFAPAQTTTPKSPTLTKPTSTSSALIPANPSSQPTPTTSSQQSTTKQTTPSGSSPTPLSPSSPTNSPTSSKSTQDSSTDSGSESATEDPTTSSKSTSDSSGSTSVPGSSTPRNSPTSPTKSPTSSTSTQGSSTENSESTTEGSTTTSKPTSEGPGSSSVPSTTTPRNSPTSPTKSPTSSTGTTGSSSSTKATSDSSSSSSTTAPTQSNSDSTSTTGGSTSSTGSTTDKHSITKSTTKDDKVTSTMTSKPSGFSASTVTNSDWTKDFILTTTIGGQETEVPVLVDSDDSAIIVFGVPIKTGIQYSLPNLPSFHFPCIFNCGSGGGGGEPGAPEQNEPDNDDNDDDDDDDDDDQSSTSTSDQTTSEATTSSSSCTSVMTVSDCIVSCPATESCSKTCFSTMTGCDITGTTSTTSGDPCSFTNTDYRCVNTTASTQTPGINEVITYTSVNYDTSRAESIEKAQETQPTTLPWGKGVTSTSVSASPSPTATASTATKTSGSTTSATPTSTTSPTSSPTTFVTSTTSTPPPICSEGNNEKMGFNNEPSSWCFCGGRGPFSTLSGSTSSYCAFTKLPSETISLTSHTTSINTGCVVTSTVVTTASASETQTYCQCGHVIAGLGTTTMSSGTMLVGCQLSDWVMMTTIQPTTTSVNPSPTEEANCFPTHGENDADKILEVVQPDGADFCNDPDRTLVDGTDAQSPAGNNYIKAGWTLADDAPEECQDFTQDDSRSLCADPLNEIVKQCPWNGGSIKNACGEFWMQTCTLGKKCDVGSPD